MVDIPWGWDCQKIPTHRNYKADLGTRWYFTLASARPSWRTVIQNFGQYFALVTGGVGWWCPSLSCPLDSLPPGGQANHGWHGWLTPRGASCPGWFILPPAHIKKILLCDVYYYLQHYNNYMQFLSYNYVNLNDYFKHSVGFLIDKGWGASCPGRFILPPAQNFKDNG